MEGIETVSINETQLEKMQSKGYGFVKIAEGYEKRGWSWVHKSGEERNGFNTLDECIKSAEEDYDNGSK